MVRSLAFAATLALALPAVSLADPPPAAQQAPPSTSAESLTGAHRFVASDTIDKDKVICHRVEVTGTRLGGSKVCKTQGQWEEETRQSQSDTGDIQRRGFQNNNVGAAATGGG